MANISERWAEFRPSKALWLWSCVGCVAATMIIGFTWGGWVTGGTATEMATDAREDARAELVANLCVENFISSPNAPQLLADLKEASSWERDDFIEDGGWAQISGLKNQVSAANDLCAEQLAAMEEVPARPVDPNLSATPANNKEG